MESHAHLSPIKLSPFLQERIMTNCLFHLITYQKEEMQMLHKSPGTPLTVTHQDLWAGDKKIFSNQKQITINLGLFVIVFSLRKHPVLPCFQLIKMTDKSKSSFYYMTLKSLQKTSRFLRWSDAPS